MAVLTLQQQLDDFLSYATGDVLIWHDPTGIASKLIDPTRLPSDVTLYVEHDMPRFELLCALNNIAPDERALVIRSRRKRIEKDDWLADLEARADSFEPDLRTLTLNEQSPLGRIAHTPQQEQKKAHSGKYTACKPEKKKQREADNNQLQQQGGRGIDAPEQHASSLSSDDASKPIEEHVSSAPQITLSETWYSRNTFLAILNEMETTLAPSNEDSKAAEAGYTLFNDCAIRGSLSSPAEYYRKLITAPLLSHSDLSPELRASTSFKTFLAGAQTSGSVFDYDEETWITLAGLRELEINRQDLDAFAQQAVTRSMQAGMPQFTVPWLRSNATDIPLLAYELSDAFYESVLLSRRRYATRGHLAGRRIFAESHMQARGRDLVESLLKLETSLDTDELYDILRTDYGIGVTHTQLVQLIRATNLFYSPELDREYASHDQFIREVE